MDKHYIPSTDQALDKDYQYAFVSDRGDCPQEAVMRNLEDIITLHRVFPRLFSIAYIYLLFRVSEWYTLLPDPTSEQTAFAGIMVPTAAAWFKFYVESK